MFEIIEITLQGVAYAMFNMTFIFGVWLIYNINKKLNVLDYYRTVNKKPFIFIMSDIILQGILVGIVGSLTLVLVGVPLYFDEMLLMIIPISLVLAIYRVRFICITYSAAILAVLSMIFNGQEFLGMTLFDVEVHVPSLIIMVGLLHLCEGVLVMISGHTRAVPILSKKDDKVIMGHILHKNWIIPLAVIALQVGTTTVGGVEMPDWWPLIKYTGYGASIFYTLIPLIGMLSYSTIVYNETPKQRARFSGLTIVGFGVITIVLGAVAVYIPIFTILGVAVMCLVHEGLYYLETKREAFKQPIYNKPEVGLRIMQIIEGGFAASVGMKQGDVIESINEEVVRDIGHLIKLIKIKREDICIETKSLNGVGKRYIVADHKELEHMGIRVIPDKPLMLHPFNELNKQGIFEFLKRK